MIFAVDKMDECGHINIARCEHLPKKTRWHSTSYERTTQKMERFIYKS